MDLPATVHDINVLTVVANESYNDFVTNLQREISDSLSDRPRLADEAYFMGKTILTDAGHSIGYASYGKADISAIWLKMITLMMMTGLQKNISEAKANGNLADLPPDLAPIAEQVLTLINSVYTDAQLPGVDNDRSVKSNPA